jgi:hypothetical protein
VIYTSLFVGATFLREVWTLMRLSAIELDCMDRSLLYLYVSAVF